MDVQGLLKLQSDEMAQLPADSREFFHINAAPCTHVAGARYAAVRMTGSQSSGAQETRVDAAGAVALECLAATFYPHALAIPQEIRHSLLGIPGTDLALARRLVSRYSTLREWVESDLAVRPVVVTRLRRATTSAELDGRLARRGGRPEQKMAT